jgi:hypothetical protein
MRYGLATMTIGRQVVPPLMVHQIGPPLGSGTAQPTSGLRKLRDSRSKLPFMLTGDARVRHRAPASSVAMRSAPSLSTQCVGSIRSTVHGLWG